MSSLQAEVMKQGVWFESLNAEEAEYNYQQYLVTQASKQDITKPCKSSTAVKTTRSNNTEMGKSSVSQQIAAARQKIQESYSDANTQSIQHLDSGALQAEIKEIRSSSEKVSKMVSDMSKLFVSFEKRISHLESLSLPASNKEVSVSKDVSKVHIAPSGNKLESKQEVKKVPVRKDCTSTLSESIVKNKKLVFCYNILYASCIVIYLDKLTRLPKL